MGNISHRGLTFIVIVGMITGMYLPNTIDTVMGDSSIIYVDDDNTEGPWKGTKEYPYKKIQDGINQSAEGDTVFVYNGLYKENVRIYTSDIIVTGEDKYSTIIDGKQNWYTLMIENNIDKRIKNIVLTNFTIKNASYDGIYVRFADEIYNKEFHHY